MPHFALPRRKFVPLFQRASEIILLQTYIWPIFRLLKPDQLDAVLVAVEARLVQARVEH